ncbi:hypothetical protein MTX78_10465 [Hymenobacter tibetensis]|uniref:DUF3108 domain-containing protein n=1 Tax=Hymenobacter tibetensis TaxID=497967 RepID=A0ABY4D4V2_9BACT|nr:hypothetical protein [Hymenobacter tibetensis]UOG77004.1 hypothetical protein MTX78_10465 [Hymenobacter tibetensis]
MLAASFSSSLLLQVLLVTADQQTQDTALSTTPRPRAADTTLMAPAPAANVNHPFGMADNTELIYRIADAAGKPSGELRQRVVTLASGEREESKKRKVMEYRTSLKSGLYDKKNALVRLQDLTFRSRRDTCFTDGLAELNTDALRSFRDRKLVYSPTPVAWPHQPTIGTTLPDGGITVQVSSSVVSIATVSTTLRKRRVVGGPTSLTTPAGTFSCYKVEAIRESATVPRPDMAMRTTVKQVDYYAPGVGIVRTEIYGKNGKVAQVRELAALNSSTQ